MPWRSGESISVSSGQQAGSNCAGIYTFLPHRRSLPRASSAMVVTTRATIHHPSEKVAVREWRERLRLAARDFGTNHLSTIPKGITMNSRAVGLSFTVFCLLMCIALPSDAQTGPGATVTVGALFPSGKYGEFFSTGYDVNAGFAIATGKTTVWHVLIGYGRIGLDNAALNESDALNSEQGKYDVSGAIHIYPLLLGITFFPDKEGVKPYGLLDFGLYMISAKFNGGTYTKPDGSQSVFAESSQFRAEPGLNVGIGALLPLSSGKSLDLGVRYNFVKDSQYSNFAGTSTTSSYVGFSQYFSLSIGLEFSY
jgi:hypothetical protein